MARPDIRAVVVTCPGCLEPIRVPVELGAADRGRTMVLSFDRSVAREHAASCTRSASDPSADGLVAGS